jgi:hypothetical protein
MKKITLLGIIILGFLITGCEQIDNIVQDEEQEVTVETEIYESDIEHDNEVEALSETVDYGSLGAISQETFTIEEMLIYAIEDEYAARAEYEYILDNFDVTTPFSNIIKSEENHISMLVPLFEAYDIELIEDQSSEHLIVVNDLEETYETGILAEEYNIAMYELFLNQENLPIDIADVFAKLRDASINHLNAFIKNAEK